MRSDSYPIYYTLKAGIFNGLPFTGYIFNNYNTQDLSDANTLIYTSAANIQGAAITLALGMATIGTAVIVSLPIAIIPGIITLGYYANYSSANEIMNNTIDTIGVLEQASGLDSYI